MAASDLYRDAHCAYLKRILLDGIGTMADKRCKGEGARLEDALRLFRMSVEDVERQAAQRVYEGMLVHGIYWVSASLVLLRQEMVPEDPCTKDIDATLLHVRTSVIALIEACFIPEVGGYRSSLCRAEPDSVLATMNAVQCLELLGASHRIPRAAVRQYIQRLQDTETGAFRYSVQAEWLAGELDLRHVLCALVTLYHVREAAQQSEETASCCTAAEGVQSCIANAHELAGWILRAQNADGGFGSRPGNESHAGYSYCAVASLALLGQLQRLTAANTKRVGLLWFLECRQRSLEETPRTPDVSSCAPPPCKLVCNGRPGKSPDVCYSWWVLASLIILLDGGSVRLDTECNSQSAADSVRVAEATTTHSGCEAALEPHSHASGILLFQHAAGGFSRSARGSATEPPCAAASIFLSDSDCSKQLAAVAPDPYHTFFALGALSLVLEALKGPAHLTKIDPRTAFPSWKLPACPM